MRAVMLSLFCWSLSLSAACPVTPLVIAHRGASGDYPEHSQSAYWQAMLQGADFIEADLVPSRDGVLVSRHENELSQSTNVAGLAQFASRKTEKVVDGVKVTGWFTEDFTLAELRQLRVRESRPQLRPQSAQHDNQEGILTLAELMELVSRFDAEHGRKVGLYLETKHPAYFLRDGVALSGEPVAQDISKTLLAALGPWQRTHAGFPVFIQSFEVSNLVWMRQQGLAQYQVDARLIQLIGDISGQALYPKSNFAQPWDLQGDLPSHWQLPPGLSEWRQAGFHYGQMLSPAGLAQVRLYADGIGPWKEQWYRQGTAMYSLTQLQKYPLWVHPYTFRAEREFLPAGVPSFAAEMKQIYQQGVDGVFTDNPVLAVQLRSQICSMKSKAP